MRTPIEANASAERVLVGRVVAVYRRSSAPAASPPRRDGTFEGRGISPSPPDSVQLAVIEILKGEASRTLMLDLRTGCQHAYELGEQWFVYARRDASRWRASSCSGTRRAEDAIADREFFARSARGEPVAALFGQVLTERSTSQREQLERSQVTVVARGESAVFSASVRAWGDFVLVLPPGRYAVQVEERGRPIASPESVVLTKDEARRWPSLR